MNCNQIRELLPELLPEFMPERAAGTDAGMIDSRAEEVTRHVASCETCSAHLEELKKTMALLDEWQAPEPSPYFDTRLQARLREEMARPQRGWMQWLLRPAWGLSLGAVLFAGALVVGNKSYFVETASIPTTPPTLSVPVQPGTAVGDLQALDKNDDLYADFDVLDDLQVQDDVTANP